MLTNLATRQVATGINQDNRGDNNDYPVLTDILDQNGSSVFGSFSSSVLTLSSPNGLWSSKSFKVYQWDNHPLVGPPSVTYQFKY